MCHLFVGRCAYLCHLLVCQCVTSLSARIFLTCLFVGVFVGPQHRTQGGEYERAQSASVSVRAAVVVEGIGRQHEPEPPLPEPSALHLPEQPTLRNQRETAML